MELGAVFPRTSGLVGANHGHHHHAACAHLSAHLVFPLRMVDRRTEKMTSRKTLHPSPRPATAKREPVNTKILRFDMVSLSTSGVRARPLTHVLLDRLHFERQAQGVGAVEDVYVGFDLAFGAVEFGIGVRAPLLVSGASAPGIPPCVE